MTTETINAAVYCRISDDARGDEAGVKRQEADCRELADALGYTVGAVFVDNDRGASTRSTKPRPAYSDMMRRASSGEFAALLAYTTSRLTRRPLEFAGLLDLVDKHGVEIRTCKSTNFDLDTADGKMIAWQLAIADSAEADRTGERVKRASVERAKQGKSHGPVAWGWTRDADSTEHLDPEPAEAIREAARRTIAGESLRAICADFNARGVKAPRGGEWVGSTLRQVLLRQRNAARRVYYGKRGPKQAKDPNYGKVTEGTWPPILSGSEQDQVTEILTKPTRSTARGRGLRYMMSNYLLCGREGCGGRCLTRSGALLPGEEKGGRRRPTSYACSTCFRCVANVAQVDAAVGGHIVNRLAMPDGPELLSSDGEAAKAAHDEIAGLRARLRSAAAMFADGTIDEDQLKTTTASIRKQIATQEAILARSAASPALGEFSRAARDSSIPEAWEAASVEVRRAIVEELCEVTLLPSGSGKRWTPKRLRVDWKRPVSAIS